MEDVLEVYQRPEDAGFPLICFDETPVQLISETRQSIPGQKGHPERYDYEYRREGTANLFMFFAPLRIGVTSKSPNDVLKPIGPLHR